MMTVSEAESVHVERGGTALSIAMPVTTPGSAIGKRTSRRNRRSCPGSRTRSSAKRGRHADGEGQDRRRLVATIERCCLIGLQELRRCWLSWRVPIEREAPESASVSERVVVEAVDAIRTAIGR